MSAKLPVEPAAARSEVNQRGIVAGVTAAVRLGIRANLGQFSLLVVINALVGAMVGQERAIVPLMASQDFAITAAGTTLAFIAAFGAVKAVTNLFAGSLADRFGRKPVLVAGWLFGLPVPIMLGWGPSWAWIVAANLLLGVNQGLAWSSTVIMKVDLAGSARRGLALGLNEAAGYLAVAASALLTGLIAERAGLRPEPFLLGLAFALMGLGLSAALVRDTSGHVEFEAGDTSGPNLPLRTVALITSMRDRTLSTACLVGLVNNLNDGAAWGLLPLLFADAGLSVAEVGLLVAIYPAVWGISQLGTGPMSDRIGRKPPIVGGMLLQALALLLVAASGAAGAWAVGMIVLGVGTALVYPTLLAVLSDRAAPRWRASATGVYRTWRDAGFVVGALGAGLLADAFGLPAAITGVAGLTALAGVFAAIRLDETRPAQDPRQFRPDDAARGSTV